MKDSNVDNKGLVIGGMTLVGVGVGFVFLNISPLFFVAAILISLGLGLVLSSLVGK